MIRRGPRPIFAAILLALSAGFVACGDDEPTSAPVPAPIPGSDEVVATISVDNPHPKVGARVVLHGATSEAVAGGSLTFAWRLVSKPAGSAVEVAEPGSVDQSFVADVAGAFAYELVVSDEQGRASAPATLTVTVTEDGDNALPHAVLEGPAHVTVGESFDFDGSHSVDADHDALTYAWTLASAPDGSAAMVSPAEGPRTAMTFDAAGTYVLSLVVDDGTSGSDAATLSVEASAPDVPPSLDAGPDAHVTVGQLYELRPMVSDPEGDDVDLSWSVTSAPAGSTAAVVLDARAEKAVQHYVFTPDVAGDYALRVTGTHAGGNTVSDALRLTAEAAGVSSQPVANAGPDQTVKVGDTVQLHGDQSYDATNHAMLGYAWYGATAPAGSSVVPFSAAEADPTFVPDQPGEYVFKLEVSVGGITSAADQVRITVNPVAPAASTYEQLVAFGLDATDAHHLEQAHAQEVDAVLAATDRILGDLVLSDAMFLGPNDPEAASLAPYGPVVEWTPQQQTRFRKIFGRVKFVANSTRFRAAFDAQANLLNAAYEDMPPTWAPFPMTFAAFRDHVNQALTDGNDQLKLYMSAATNGVARGAPPLLLMVQQVMMGTTVADPGGVKKGWGVNGAAPLVFHELTHSFGYAHDGPGNAVNNRPNNLPYFVQIIMGYQADDILAVYCQASPTCDMPFYSYGAPNSLLTFYFGADAP